MPEGASGWGFNNSRRIFAAAAGAACVANASWWMQPLVMHNLSDTRHLGEFAGGMALTVEMTVMALTSVLVGRLLVGRSLLLLAFAGLILAIGGNAIAIETDNYALLLVARAVAGAGAGLGLTMMNAAAALFPDPDRAFARLGVINILFGMVIMGAMSLYPSTNPFVMILLALLLTIPAVAFMPRSVRIRAPEGSEAKLDRGTSRRVALLAAITFAIGCASGIMWAFYALIGDEAGLSMEAVDGAISMAIFAALCAAGIASLIGGRLGRVVPVGAGVTVLAMAVAVLSSHPTEVAFRIATMGNVGALYFLTPYLFGAAAAQDSSGRGAIYVGSAFYLTGAVGPALGGFLAVTIGMEVVGIATVVIAIASFLTLWRIERKGAKSAPDFSHEGPVMALHPQD